MSSKNSKWEKYKKDDRSDLSVRWFYIIFNSILYRVFRIELEKTEQGFLEVSFFFSFLRKWIRPSFWKYYKQIVARSAMNLLIEFLDRRNSALQFFSLRKEKKEFSNFHFLEINHVKIWPIIFYINIIDKIRRKTFVKIFYTVYITDRPIHNSRCAMALCESDPHDGFLIEISVIVRQTS